MKKTLTLVLIAVVAFFYLFKEEKLQESIPVAKKEVVQKAVAINYEGAMVIKHLDNIDDILSELESKPPAGTGTFDLTTMSTTITTEALKAFSDSAKRSLPLLAHWNVGIPEFIEAMDPMYMISRIELGEHILVSWKLDPYYNDSISSSYYEESIKKAAELNLPLVFVLPAPESALTKDRYYFSLENATNPNVVTAKGDVLEKLSPFGPDELWNEIGEQWCSTSLMVQLQEWYPNPPLVLFVSQDEAAKLSWNDSAVDSRYTGSGDDNFKRTLIGAEWIEKYRQMHDGFKKGLINTTWKENVKFMSYNKFSQNLGESNWLENATLTNHYMNIWPLTADGATVDFDLSGSKTDNSADAPHVLANNLPFMLNEAKLVNPNFAYQLSLDTVSKVTEPAKYRGLTQFALWFLRPSIIRQDSQESDREALAPLFQEVADSVELIHYNEELATFWREGKLVNSGESDLNQNIPEQYLNDPRWFLLDTDTNPPRPWADNTSIPVWAFALVKGETPNREWLVYAQSPDRDISNVTVTVPGYKDVLLDSRVNGSFYVLEERNSKSNIVNIQPQVLIHNTSSNKNQNNMTNDFQLLHNITKQYKSPKKIISINSTLKTIQESSEKWHKGTWFRGYSSSNGLEPADSWFEPIGNNFYWSAHPLVRWSARYGNAYLHAYKASNNPLYKQNMHDAMNYLVNVAQKDNGGYIWWQYRPGKETVNTGENTSINSEHIFSTSLALSFMSKVYLLNLEEEEQQHVNYIAIEKAADWLYKQNLEQWNSNFHAFCASAMSVAYKVTKKEKYLEKAINMAEWIIKKQEPFDDPIWSGTWRTGGIDNLSNGTTQSINHDTTLWYHFIIIRGLIETLSVLPDDYAELKENLKRSIVYAINHAIDKRLSSDTNTFTTYYLDKDGKSIKPKLQKYYPDSIAVEALSMLTYYAYRNSKFTTQEQINLLNLLNTVIKGCNTNSPAHFSAFASYYYYISKINL